MTTLQYVQENPHAAATELDLLHKKIKEISHAGKYLRNSLAAQLSRQTFAYDPDADRAALFSWDSLVGDINVISENKKDLK